ncbi:cohesin domain-containing protein [Candidatus Margulisiibacteriota bacterium]
MIRKILIIGGLGFLLVTSSVADIAITGYKVDGFRSQNYELEVGANFVVEIGFENETGSDQTIVGAKFDFTYDTNLLEYVSYVDELELPENVNQTPVVNEGNGEIHYQRVAGAGGSGGVDVPAGGEQECLKFTFHVIQDNNNAGTQTLFEWVPEEDVLLAVSGGGNIAGEVAPFPAAQLKTGADPTSFTGIGSVGDAGNAGNRLEVIWADTADDETDGAATYYSNKKLKYRVYRDSDPTPVHTSDIRATSWTNSNLNDNTPYTFKVTAIDDCSPNANESETATTITATPHDYTAPDEPSQLKITKLNEAIELDWDSPGGDVHGYMVVKGDGREPNPHLIGARENQENFGKDNGEDYPVGTILNDGSTVVYRDTTTSFRDTDVVNGVDYYYAVYAYDKVGGDPIQQGNNYSEAAGKSGAPGAEPAVVSNLRALSDPAAGDITLIWTNPSDLGNYGGVLAVYTTNFDLWNDITRNSAVTDPSNYAEADIPVENPPTDQTVTSDTLTDLSTTEVYYFKVFTYNIVTDNVREARTYNEDGVKVAAVPLKGVGGGGVQIVTIEDLREVMPDVTVKLTRKEEDFGINYTVLPYSPTFYTEDDRPINSLGDLVNEIARQESENEDMSIGYWDSTAQKWIGFIFEKGKVKRKVGTTKEPGEMPLVANRAYQVNVKKSSTVKLKGRQGK